MKSTPVEQAVRIPTPEGGEVAGDLALPADCGGLVVFAHGSGSSRHSPRNRWVAAALVAAAGRPAGIAAVVSRGGRPDLAGADLAAVQAPAPLIVGGRDEVVLGLNREAYAHLRGERRLDIVPGATHLFEEPGALEVVMTLAGDWFTRHLLQAEPSGGASSSS